MGYSNECIYNRYTNFRATCSHCQYAFVVGDAGADAAARPTVLWKLMVGFSALL
jgi:hypothetical protein